MEDGRSYARQKQQQVEAVFKPSQSSVDQFGYRWKAAARVATNSATGKGPLFNVILSSR